MVKHFLWAVGFVLLGLATDWILKTRVGIQGDAVLVSAMLLPLLVYLSLSGHLAEFRGPGGLAAKFRQIQEWHIEGVTSTVKAVADVAVEVAKHSSEGLNHWLQHYAPHDFTTPVLLSLVEGRQYDRQVLHTYLTGLTERFPRFSFVVVLDAERRVLAHVSAVDASAGAK
jgi:hypothetical protein